MQLIKTVDSENMLRLEEDGGAALTVKKTEVAGRILSLIVPKDDRREGIGSELIKAAEHMLYSEGIKKIDADFPDTIGGMKEFFEQAGYDVKKSAPIISVSMKSLLGSLTVRRAMANELDDAVFVPLADLMVDQLDSLLEQLSNFKIDLSNSDIARFMQECSGVVYDNKNIPQAFILCSEASDGILVDLLAAVGGSNPKFIIVAMQGMLNGIVAQGGSKTFDTLSMLASNKNVNELLVRVLKKGVEPQHVGDALYASKTISDPYDNTEDIEDDLDEDLEDEWRREIKKVPFQANINWKMPWHRESASSEEDESSPAALARKKKARAAATAQINFEKDEDDLEGLICDDTIRITTENLFKFENAISEGAYRNMPRPFYRGLAVVDDENVLASIVWEYKNVEDDADTEARIEWFTARDADSAKTLLTEYCNEILTEEVKKSYFEFSMLSEDEMSALKDAGFNISREESLDLVVPVSVVKASAFAEKKPADYVKNITAINEKQFKRGIANGLFHNRKGLLEDAAFLPMAWFDQKASCCVMADEKVVGFLLLHRNGEDSLFVDLLFSLGAEFTTDILNMIRFSVHALADYYPDTTSVVIRRHNDEIMGLTAKLFPGHTGETVYYGERREP